MTAALDCPSAMSTSSVNSPEYKCTLSSGRPGTRVAAASEGPMKSERLGTAVGGRGLYEGEAVPEMVCVLLLLMLLLLVMKLAL